MPSTLSVRIASTRLILHHLEESLNGPIPARQRPPFVALKRVNPGNPGHAPVQRHAQVHGLDFDARSGRAWFPLGVPLGSVFLWGCRHWGRGWRAVEEALHARDAFGAHAAQHACGLADDQSLLEQRGIARVRADGPGNPLNPLRNSRIVAADAGQSVPQGVAARNCFASWRFRSAALARVPPVGCDLLL